MPRAVLIVTSLTAAISGIAWLYGFFSVGYGYYWRDFWFHLVIFLVPVAFIGFGVWILSGAKIWQKVLGIVLLVPSVAIWILYILLALNGFRIH